MKTITVKGKAYNLHWISGTVLGSGKNLETTVSGGGVSYNANGGGYSAPVVSTTTVHDQIFIQDDKGKEHAFQLRDFNIACREGHDLTVFWLVHDGKEKGYYVAVRNVTTGKMYFQTNTLEMLFLSNKAKTLLIAAACGFLPVFLYAKAHLPEGAPEEGSVFFGLLAGLLGLLVGRIIWGVSGNSAAKNFKATFRAEDYC